MIAAVSNGREDLVDFYLENGADLNLKNINGADAYLFAEWNFEDNILAKLTERQNNQQQTELGK